MAANPSFENNQPNYESIFQVSGIALIYASRIIYPEE